MHKCSWTAADEASIWIRVESIWMNQSCVPKIIQTPMNKSGTLCHHASCSGSLWMTSLFAKSLLWSDRAHCTADETLAMRKCCCLLWNNVWLCTSGERCMPSDTLNCSVFLTTFASLSHLKSKNAYIFYFLYLHNKYSFKKKKINVSLCHRFDKVILAK